jgi:heme O synthase-like polyprenyltransferase
MQGNCKSKADTGMNPVTRHLLLPAIMSAAFFAVALSPVGLLGCRTRGLLALLIAFASGMMSLGAAITCSRERIRGDNSARWWFASSVILVIPVIAMIIMA